jgi:hypothetical protein
MSVGDHELAVTEDVDAELAVVDPARCENGVRADEMLPDASASNSAGATLAGTQDGVRIDTDNPAAHMNALAVESLHDLLHRPAPVPGMSETHSRRHESQRRSRYHRARSPHR